MTMTEYEITLKTEKKWEEVAQTKLLKLSVSELNDLIAFVDITTEKFSSISTPYLSSSKLTRDFAGQTIWISILNYKNKLNINKLAKIKKFLFSIKTNYVDGSWSFRFMDWIDIGDKGEDVFLFSLKDFILLNKIKSIIKEKRLQGKLTEIPENTKWEDISICFQEDTEKINLHIKNTLIGAYSFYELNMGKNKPDRLWNFLSYLSSFNSAGINKRKIKPDVSNILNSEKFNKKENIEKIISDLSKKLKEAFGLYINPFYLYKEFSEYRTKFNLQPVPSLRPQKNKIQTTELDENKDYDDNKIY